MSPFLPAYPVFPGEPWSPRFPLIPGGPGGPCGPGPPFLPWAGKKSTCVTAVPAAKVSNGTLNFYICRKVPKELLVWSCVNMQHIMILPTCTKL